MGQRAIGSIFGGLPNLVFATKLSTIPRHRAVLSNLIHNSAWHPRDGSTMDIFSNFAPAALCNSVCITTMLKDFEHPNNSEIYVIQAEPSANQAMYARIRVGNTFDMRASVTARQFGTIG